jgi:outer membrane protein assembly factor BamB
MMRHKLWIFLLILPALLLCSCFDFNNPLDPEADDYQGYLSVKSIEDVEPESPANGGETWRELTCSNYKGADLYWIQISSSATDFEGNLVYEKTDYASPEIHIPKDSAVQADVPYYWRVKAHDFTSGEWAQEWSSTREFTMPRVKWVYYSGSDSWLSPALMTDGSIIIGSWNFAKLFAINKDGTLLFEFATETKIRSNASIGSDNQIYYIHGAFGGDDGDLSKQRRVYSIFENGDLNWYINIDSDDHEFSSPGIGNDGSIYVGTSARKVYAIEPEGSIAWEYGTNDIISHPVCIGEDGSVYVLSNDGRLHSISQDGDLNWSENLNGSGYSPIIIDDGKLLAVGNNNWRLILFETDGTIIWQWDSPDDILSSPVVGPDGTIYILYANGVYALNPSGTLKWNTALSSFSGMRLNTPSVGADGSIFFVSGNTGVLYALDSEGNIKWTVETDGTAAGNPTISPDGTLYFVSSPDLYAINTDSGGLADSPWPMYMHDPQHTGNAAYDWRAAMSQ